MSQPGSTKSRDLKRKQPLPADPGLEPSSDPAHKANKRQRTPSTSTAAAAAAAAAAAMQIRSGPPTSTGAPVRAIQIDPVGVWTPSDQRPREEKSAPYQTPQYPFLLETKGSYMSKSPLDITDQSKRLCETLLNNEQPVPKESLFDEDIFESVCETLGGSNEARVVQDISPLSSRPFTTSLQVADCQNAHSMTLAVRAVVELFRAVKREDEIHRQILAISISHDNQCVRIYGHYPVIDGENTKYYRYPIHSLDLIALDGKKKMDGIPLPTDLNFDVPSLPQTGSQTGLSQGVESLMQSEVGPASLVVAEEDPADERGPDGGSGSAKRRRSPVKKG
ncbi:uncharacterized protein C8A04DRAFT_30219 [Dichotomopilus funicola]|uniref:DUF7924 domain-containing protein n=1 Tax=Dichotomopilus funicola TaxID=1934379 RepID=A0AAN6UZU0_9PEZI|nr:hypothetical protein C8A04DRAFT_30219 [Dichotomopilus funicola]